MISSEMHGDCVGDHDPGTSDSDLRGIPRMEVTGSGDEMEAGGPIITREKHLDFVWRETHCNRVDRGRVTFCTVNLITKWWW